MGGRGASNIGSGNYQNGVNLYRQFVEGDSAKIHSLFGSNVLTGRSMQPNQKAMRDIETVFSPAKSDLKVYKGMPVTDSDINKIKKGEMINQLISSTSKSKVVAKSYADNADGEYTSPLTMNITIKKGTKIADAQKILGAEGMKGFEKEVTVWKGTKWKYSNLKEHENQYGDISYTVDVIVSK